MSLRPWPPGQGLAMSFKRSPQKGVNWTGMHVGYLQLLSTLNQALSLFSDRHELVTYRAGFKLEPTCCSLGQARGRGQRIPVEDADGAIHGSDGPAIPPLPLPPREEQVIVPLATNAPTQGDDKGIQETNPIPPNGGLDTQLS